MWRQTPLVAPYRAILRDYLSDAPYCALWGFWCLNMANWVRYPLPFSERFPLGEHAKWRCDTPPQKGYLSDTCATPYENKANGCDTPLCKHYLERVLRDMGGYLTLAAKLETPLDQKHPQYPEVPRGPKD